MMFDVGYWLTNVYNVRTEMKTSKIEVDIFPKISENFWQWSI